MPPCQRKMTAAGQAWTETFKNDRKRKSEVTHEDRAAKRLASDHSVGASRSFGKASPGSSKETPEKSAKASPSSSKANTLSDADDEPGTASGEKRSTFDPDIRTVRLAYWFSPTKPVQMSLDFPALLKVLDVKNDILPALGLQYNAALRLECWEPEESRFVRVSKKIMLPDARDSILLKASKVKGSLEGLGQGISHIERRDEMYQSGGLRYVPLTVVEADAAKEPVNAAEQASNVDKKAAKVGKGKGRAVSVVSLSESEGTSEGDGEDSDDEDY